jgi:hypothetical protein
MPYTASSIEWQGGLEPPPIPALSALDRYEEDGCLLVDLDEGLVECL